MLDPRPIGTVVTGRRLAARALPKTEECLGINARNALARSGAAGALTPAASDDVDAMAPRVAHACAREAVRPGRERASCVNRGVPGRCPRATYPSFREKPGETNAELDAFVVVASRELVTNEKAREQGRDPIVFRERKARGWKNSARVGDFFFFSHSASRRAVT